MLRSLAVFSGNANLPLARSICQFLEVPLGQAVVSAFSDGETRVEVSENVRGVHCYVVQPTCTRPNESLMELLVLIDTLRRASDLQTNGSLSVWWPAMKPLGTAVVGRAHGLTATNSSMGGSHPRSDT